MAFIFAPFTALTMAPVQRAETGYATGLFNVMRTIGSSMGVSFVATWVARRSQCHQSILIAHVIPGRLRVQQFLEQTPQQFR